MLARGDIRCKTYISYGAMNSIFQYLEQLEVIKMQATSCFMYHRGVERLQKRIEWQRQNLFFALPGNSECCPKTVFGYDAIKDKILETISLPEHFPFNLNKSRSVQWGKSLLIFTEGLGGSEVKAYQLSLENFDNPTFTQLASPNKSMSSFAVALC